MARSLPKPPLTDADYANINKMLTQAAQLQAEIDRATAAGFPCAEMDQECKARVEQWKKIKAAYFPDRP
jgi:hypothetical protein